MSRPGQNFIGIVEPAEKLSFGDFGGPAFLSVFLRDQFTLSTWLCIGAIVQGILFLTAGRLALIPAIAVVLFRILDNFAMAMGWKRNVYMDDVIQKKFSAVFPDESGNYGNKPSNEDVVVFLIGTRNNHPLGLLAPGAKDLSQYFPTMVKDLEANAEEWGYLGMTSWLNSSARTAGSEIMEVCYFRTVEGLHKFAHSKVHREGWDWWNRTVKQHPHLSIWHETYHVPKGHWESIYVNSHVAGINSTAFKIADEMTGKEMWARPMVDASKGLLKTSAGRMARSDGKEHDKFGADPYDPK